MAILEVENLTKKYGKLTAVDNISFSLKKGEILGLLGPNGAGKTTTIQMLLGLLTPDSGKISYFGQKLTISNREKIAERINFSSNYSKLPNLLTIKEILTYTALLYTIENRPKRLQKIENIFRLENLWNKKMTSLSSGQKTRVNLAKSLINYPDILLLDEPTASLDPEAAQYIRGFFLQERENFQTSLIITSHDMAEVEELCDRVLFLDEGKLIANDSPEKLAKEISTANLTLLVTKNSHKLKTLSKKHNLDSEKNDNYFTFTINEDKISEFLTQLNQQDIQYSEISIDKPSLKDYFLQIANNKKS